MAFGSGRNLLASEDDSGYLICTVDASGVDLTSSQPLDCLAPAKQRKLASLCEQLAEIAANSKKPRV